MPAATMPFFMAEQLNETDIIPWFSELMLARPI